MVEVAADPDTPEQVGQGARHADDTASFERAYDRSENWGDGVRTVRLTDSPLDCTLTYTIQAE